MDQESTEPLSEELSEKILQYYQDRLKQADIVCLQDYDKGLLTAPICKQMIQLAAQAKRKVLVDPCLTGDYSKYAGATLITPNREEASTAVGFEIRTAEDAARAADVLAKRLRFNAVVITLDKEGAFLRTRKKSALIPTKPRSVYDVTGAGDTVLATLAISLAAGCDYETAVQLANTAGGIEVEKFGAATVTVEEIVKEIVGQTQRANGKLRDVDTLTEELAWHRKQNHTIVFTNGCFDVIHRGHIELLKFCKQQGDIVVLGLNSDSSVKTIKDPQRPINNQEDRAAVLAALESIDYIAFFDEPTPIKLIKKVRPDVLVKGQDWAGKGVVGQEFVESYGGKVALAPIIKGKSTTETIDRIKSLVTASQKETL